jgi:DNA-binding transcriptional ArsR family regulator
VSADADAKFLDALAEPTRLRIVEHLAAGPAVVSAITAALGLKMVTVSQHFARLRDGGVVVVERDSTFIRYRLLGAEVAGGTLTLRRPGVNLVMMLEQPVKKGKKK